MFPRFSSLFFHSLALGTRHIQYSVCIQANERISSVWKIISKKIRRNKQTTKHHINAESLYAVGPIVWYSSQFINHNEILAYILTFLCLDMSVHINKHILKTQNHHIQFLLIFYYKNWFGTEILRQKPKKYLMKYENSFKLIGFSWRLDDLYQNIFIHLNSLISLCISNFRDVAKSYHIRYKPG